MFLDSIAAREADETAQKRAQTEQFSFDVDAPGMVEVTNERHENPQTTSTQFHRRRDTRTDGLYVSASRPSERLLQTHGCRRNRNRRRDAQRIPIGRQRRQAYQWLVHRLRHVRQRRSHLLAV